MIVKQYDKDYVEDNKLSLLDELGTNIDFNDDIWVCDKYRRNISHSGESYKLYFRTTPFQYREIVKYYCLSKGGNIITLNGEIENLRYFFEFLSSKHNGIPLKDVNKRHIYDYELYVQSLELSKSTKKDLFPTLRRFFEYMHEHDDMPETNPVSVVNPFKISRSELKFFKKYIPKSVIKQLDLMHKNEIIPLHHRLLYWIMRSIPSRVSEVVAMKLDCIKPYGNDWVIVIPTWKGNGGYKSPQNRLIHVQNKGHGKFLLELIREQQVVSKMLQDKMDKEKRGLLFTVERYQFDGLHYKKTGNMRYIKHDVPPYVVNQKSVNNMMQNNIKRFGVKGEDGKIYNLTSHQLRHNGITDRLYAGFSTVEIRDMTGANVDESIIDSYYHSVPEKNKEISNNIKARYTEKLLKEPAYYKGRIMNIDKNIEKKILSNPRAYEITDGENTLGLCTDITGCKSGLFQCLDCDYFAPNIDSVEYFEKQVEIWKEKCRLFKGQREGLENAKYNLSCYRALLIKIQKTHEEKLKEVLVR